MRELLDVIVQSLPIVIAALGGFICSFVVYLTKRIKYKQAVIDAEAKNIELQTAIVNGSYIICPSCGDKIMLKDTKVFTGGIIDEKTKSE